MRLPWRSRRVETDTLRSRLAAAEAELGRLRHAGDAVIRHLPEPLVLLDGARRVLRVNAAGQTAFRDTLGAVLRHPRLRAALDAALPDQPQVAELDGGVGAVVATAIALDPPLADGGRFLLALSDRSREQAVDRVRADFVANASHELRTPLTTLIGFIDTLRGAAADDPEAPGRFLPIMAEHAARMRRLIDDLLSLSRVEANERQPPRAEVDLAALLRDLLPTLVAVGAERGAAVTLDLAPGLPPVLGDADQLVQVWTNLVENAVKYGRADGGAVRVAAAPAEDGDVAVTVADNGPGIARVHLPRLTERFYRVDTGRSRAAGGTGLGLAIVRHIVQRHQGRLRIDSTEGEGTTVGVRLPAAGPTGTRA